MRMLRVNAHSFDFVDMQTVGTVHCAVVGPRHCSVFYNLPHDFVVPSARVVFSFWFSFFVHTQTTTLNPRARVCDTQQQRSRRLLWISPYNNLRCRPASRPLVARMRA